MQIVSETVVDDQFRIKRVVGNDITVKLIAGKTLILRDCHFELTADEIEPGLRARIIGMFDGDVIIAVAVLLRPSK